MGGGGISRASVAPPAAEVVDRRELRRTWLASRLGLGLGLALGLGLGLVLVLAFVLMLVLVLGLGLGAPVRVRVRVRVRATAHWDGAACRRAAPAPAHRRRTAPSGRVWTGVGEG